MGCASFGLPKLDFYLKLLYSECSSSSPQGRPGVTLIVTAIAHNDYRGKNATRLLGLLFEAMSELTLCAEYVNLHIWLQVLTMFMTEELQQTWINVTC